MPAAQSTPYERLQPCLFNRLVDDEPQNQKESVQARMISLSDYQVAVLTDLRWLLNCNCHTADENLSDFPDVESSVFNFGVPSTSGLGMAGMNMEDLESSVKRAIRQFEPRISEDTLEVRAVLEENDHSPNTLFFEISGELWARPFPEKLFIKTSLDLETGAMTIKNL